MSKESIFEKKSLFPKFSILLLIMRLIIKNLHMIRIYVCMNLSVQETKNRKEIKKKEDIGRGGERKMKRSGSDEDKIFRTKMSLT